MINYCHNTYSACVSYPLLELLNLVSTFLFRALN